MDIILRQRMRLIRQSLRLLPGVSWLRQMDYRLLPGAALAYALLGILVALGALLRWLPDVVCSSYLAVQGVILLGLYCLGQARYRRWNHSVLAAGVVSVAMVVALRAMPEHVTGWQLHGVIHRALFSGIGALVVATLSCCFAVYYLLGATPHAADKAHYPAVLLLVGITGLAYAFVLGQVVIKAVPGLDPAVIFRPFHWEEWKEMVTNGAWPTWETHALKQAGMLNHILGTAQLVALTAAIALPLGAGAGVFLSEYSDNHWGAVVRFAISALRAMSVFILGLTALSIVQRSSGTWLSDLFCGFYYDRFGSKHAGRGSYLTASLVLSLLIIPVIARATEEGCRSLPQAVREGSWALGATDGYTLRRIILPWAFPNIMTGLLLGAAEAAGSVAVIMFMAGTGQHGVGPLGEVTSLSALIFQVRYGSKYLRDAMRPYQFSAALLLVIITMGLTVSALVLRARIAKRFRGA